MELTKEQSAFFAMFILSQGNFFNIHFISMSITNFQDIYTLIYQKRLLHILLLLVVFKITESLLHSYPCLGPSFFFSSIFSHIKLPIIPASQGSINKKLCHAWRILAVQACVCYFLSHFYFFTKRQPFKDYEKCFLFHLKSSFSSQDIKIFVVFFLPSHIFQIQKDKWRWNNSWCHELVSINLQM